MRLLEGGRVLCPATGLDQVADVLIDDDGRVSALGPDLVGRQGLRRQDCQVIDCSGAVVMPGLVDLVCDVADPGTTWREDITTASRAAAAGGFTALLASPATDPTVDSAAVAAGVVEAAQDAPAARVYRAGALTVGLAGADLAEMGSMIAEGCIALSDGGRSMADSAVLRHALAYARPFGAPVLLRPGEPSLERQGCMHEGRISVEIGLRGIPAASEEIGLARILGLVRTTGAAVHVSHVTTARSVAMLAQARSEGLPVTSSVPARQLVLTDAYVRDSVYDTAARLLPPLRSEADRQALIEGLRAGVIDTICSDHVPWSQVDKELEFERAAAGAVGLETALQAACTALEGDLPLIARAMATAPAGILGLQRRIAVDAPADLVVFDPAVDAAVETPRWSKSRNEPLRGVTLRGMVRATIRSAACFQPQ